MQIDPTTRRVLRARLQTRRDMLATRLKLGALTSLPSRTWRGLHTSGLAVSLEAGRRARRLVRRALGRPQDNAPAGPRVSLIGAAAPARPAEELSGLPIVFMHRGDSFYLRYCLGQARISNPTSPIYLLGDARNNRYDFVEHRHYSDYFELARELGRAYRHFSTNEFIYTLFDIQRWFILREFLTAHGYEQCLYLDSDVMLYSDVTQDRYKFARYGFAMAHMTGSVFFLNRLAALEDLNRFILDIYTRKDRYHYDRMVAHYLARQNNRLPGGACDMIALYYYREAHFGAVGEVSDIIDGSVYDRSINIPQGFEMQAGIKRLEWRGPYPYGIHTRTGEAIRFNALHCQGGKAKKMIEQFYRPDMQREQAAAEAGASLAQAVSQMGSG